MKRIFLYTSISVLFFGIISCNLLNSDQSDDIFKYMPGEVLVTLEDEYTLKDLRSVLENLEAEWSRSLGTSYVIKVVEGNENLWTNLLKDEEVIRDAQLNRFGYNYRIIDSEDFPTFKNDSLVVEITYSGCNSGHDYSLEYKRIGSTFELWLFKETPDEPCRAIIRDIQSFKIPKRVTESLHIFLLNPVDDRIILQS